jgi:hypothetical protein
MRKKDRGGLSSRYTKVLIINRGYDTIPVDLLIQEGLPFLRRFLLQASCLGFHRLLTESRSTSAKIPIVRTTAFLP